MNKKEYLKTKEEWLKESKKIENWVINLKDQEFKHLTLKNWLALNSINLAINVFKEHKDKDSVIRLQIYQVAAKNAGIPLLAQEIMPWYLFYCTKINNLVVEILVDEPIPKQTKFDIHN